MFRNKVIFAYFRFTKDMRDKQQLSFAEERQAHSEPTWSHLQASKSALEVIKAVFDKALFKL